MPLGISPSSSLFLTKKGSGNLGYITSMLTNFLHWIQQNSSPDGLTSFVEIAFAVNVITGAYAKLRDYFVGLLLTNYLSSVLAFQNRRIPPEQKESFSTIFSEKLKKLQSKHVANQKKLSVAALVLSLITAIACILILYLGLHTSLGNFNGLLILPLPLYCIASLLLYVYYYGSAWLELRRARVLEEYHCEQK